MPEKLTDTEIEQGLEGLNGWSRKGDSIVRNFELKDFEKALSFVNKIGAEAQKADHHPDIFLHDWNQVEVTLSTHSAKGITKNDIELAGKVDAL